MFAPYRWEKGTELGLCRQRRPRRRTRAVLLAVVVGGMDYRMWGKATAAVLLRRQAYTVSRSIIGLMLATLGTPWPG